MKSSAVVKRSGNGETMNAVLALAGNKLRAKMGAHLNESAATGPSDFARAQLEKMGWSEGKGLGKNHKGMTTHIRVKKRVDEEGGLGNNDSHLDASVKGVIGKEWWKSSVGDTLARLKRNAANKGSGKKKDKKSKKSSKKTKQDHHDKKRKREFTDQELFEATGGARFGMRAQARQTGKWQRTELKGDKHAEEEAKAKEKVEWNGQGIAVVVLPDDAENGNKSKLDKKGHQAESPIPPAIEAKDQSESKSEKKAKKEKKSKKSDKKNSKKKSKSD